MSNNQKGFAILPISALKASTKFRFDREWWMFSTAGDSFLKAFYFRPVGGGFVASYRDFDPNDKVGVFTATKATNFINFDI